MKKFMLGLLLGWLATYSYLSHGEYFRSLASQLWARASAPPLRRSER